MYDLLVVKNIKSYTEASEKERKKYLKGLSLKKASRIMETLLRSKIWREMFHKHDDHPTSIQFALKHAK